MRVCGSRLWDPSGCWHWQGAGEGSGLWPPPVKDQTARGAWDWLGRASSCWIWGIPRYALHALPAVDSSGLSPACACLPCALLVSGHRPSAPTQDSASALLSFGRSSGPVSPPRCCSPRCHHGQRCDTQDHLRPPMESAPSILGGPGWCVIWWPRPNAGVTAVRRS